ncbi:hypothetical protein [Winogradskyella sp.]|uniref:hypothetical protein n=1 Tax=Winogradskyella sp. TaxID=1883156 RepID=UPI003BAC084B
MSAPSILRQIKDIQAQAERLIRTGGNTPEIEAFAQFNESLKSYLLQHIKEEFILNYIKTIPSLDIDALETKSNFFIGVISLFFGRLGATYSERNRINTALKIIKEISNKYASYEIMIANSLET